MLSQSLQKLARRAVAPTRRTFQQGALPAWATVDPWAMSGAACERLKALGQHGSLLLSVCGVSGGGSFAQGE